MLTLERTVAEILLGIKAIKVRVDPPFKWVSGMVAPIYTDNRMLMSYPAERNTIVKCFTNLIHNMGIQADAIAGVATSGIPWASWVAAALEKPMVYARKQEKGYGLENLIEGSVKPGQHVVVIEDLISTGGSAVSAVEAVRQAGGVVENCLAIFDYEMRKAIDNFKQAKCRLVTLSNFSVLVQVASEMGKISPDEKDTVLEWSKDPDGWAKHLGK